MYIQTILGFKKCHSLKKIKINAEKGIGKEKSLYIVGKNYKLYSDYEN